METGPWTKSDPNLRFRHVNIWFDRLWTDVPHEKRHNLFVAITKHVGQLIRDNRDFFVVKKYNPDDKTLNYSFQTKTNPWGQGGPERFTDKHELKYVTLKSISSKFPRFSDFYSFDERFYIGPDEWLGLKNFGIFWEDFQGTVLFDYSDPDNIKIRTSWLEQAILKWRQEKQGKVPSLFTLAKKASDTYRLGIPTNTVRTTDTYKRKRDPSDVQVTVQGYVF